jgi:hypothetical protein
MLYGAIGLCTVGFQLASAMAGKLVSPIVEIFPVEACIFMNDAGSRKRGTTSRPQDLLAIRTPNMVRHFRRASQHDWSVHN